MFERCSRNKRLASRRLNISYHTLQTYLRQLGWQPSGHRRRRQTRRKKSELRIESSGV
jgi:hypothetical protein